MGRELADSPDSAVVFSELSTSSWKLSDWRFVRLAGDSGDSIAAPLGGALPTAAVAAGRCATRSCPARCRDVRGLSLS